MRTAFISSFTRELTPVRQELADLSIAHGNVWVAEVARPDLNTNDCSSFEIVDLILKKIRESDLFVCLLSGNRRGEDELGTALDVGPHFASVSHFEIELYQASILQKEIHVFVTPEFNPGPRLVSLLEILNFAFPKSDWTMVKSNSHLVDEIVSLLHRTDPRPRHVESSTKGQLILKLYQDRKKKLGGGGHPDKLFFLNNEFPRRRRSEINWELVNLLFESHEREKNNEMRLSQMWLVMRELKDGDHLSDEVLVDWEHALGQWGAGAAWYGLHGHLYAGGLAAVFSVAEARKRIREKGIDLRSGKTPSHPSSAIASALYSIAKLMPNRSIKRTLYRNALDEIETGMNDKLIPNKDGLLAVRGNIFLRQFNFWAAAKDFERCLNLRVESGKSITKVAEVTVNLGLAIALSGNPWRGAKLARRGIDMFQKDRVKDYPLFCRALKMAAKIHLLTGNLSEVKRCNDQRRKIAREMNFLDQIGGL